MTELDGTLRAALLACASDPYDLIIDIETNGFRRQGMIIHSIEAIVLPYGEQVHGADQPGFTPPADMRWLIENARRVIGHNIKVFDLPALERVLGVVIPPERIVDTLIASRVLTADRRELDALNPAMPADLVGRHSLDSWGWRLKVRKDIFAHRQDQPWSRELQAHCKLDTIISWALFDHLLDINAEIAA